MIGKIAKIGDLKHIFEYRRFWKWYSLTSLVTQGPSPLLARWLKRALPYGVRDDDL